LLTHDPLSALLVRHAIAKTVRQLLGLIWSTEHRRRRHWAGGGICPQISDSITTQIYKSTRKEIRCVAPEISEPALSACSS